MGPNGGRASPMRSRCSNPSPVVMYGIIAVGYLEVEFYTDRAPRVGVALRLAQLLVPVPVTAGGVITAARTWIPVLIRVEYHTSEPYLRLHSALHVFSMSVPIR